MSVDAKVFVTCGKDKLFEVVNSVIKTLNTFQRKELDKFIEQEEGLSRRFDVSFKTGFDGKRLYPTWSNGVSGSFYNMDMLSVQFGLGEKHSRILSIFPDCSCDYNDIYDGDKILFSIGCWGRSDDIMKAIIPSLKDFGDVYYDHNDCDDEDFVKV